MCDYFNLGTWVLNRVSGTWTILERQEKIQDKKKSNDRTFIFHFYCLLMPHEGITGSRCQLSMTMNEC